MTDKRRAALDAAALEWQAEGKQQLNALSRVSLAQDQAILLPEPTPSLARTGSRKAVPVPPPASPAAAAAASQPQQQQQQQQMPGFAGVPPGNSRRQKTGGWEQKGPPNLC